jgi:hypothetical protein
MWRYFRPREAHVAQQRQLVQELKLALKERGLRYRDAARRGAAIVLAARPWQYSGFRRFARDPAGRTQAR